MVRKLLLLLFFFIGVLVIAFSLITKATEEVSVIFVPVLAGLAVMLVVFVVGIFVLSGEGKHGELEVNFKNLTKENQELVKHLNELENKVQSNSRMSELISIVQGSATLELAATELLKKMAKDLEICQGVFYIQSEEGNSVFYKPKGTYAYHKPMADIVVPEIGVGLVGQSAKNKKMLVLNELPSGYIEIVSGLGKSQPSYVAIIPLINKDVVVGVLELATLKTYSENEIKYFEQMQEGLGFAVYLLSEKIKLNTPSKILG